LNNYLHLYPFTIFDMNIGLSMSFIATLIVLGICFLMIVVAKCKIKSWYEEIKEKRDLL